MWFKLRRKMYKASRKGIMLRLHHRITAILLIRSSCSFIKTHLCTLALSLTLFNTVRLPREAFRYGVIPYLVVYSLWVLAVGYTTSLLQLAIGQLSRQGPVGVWRAVPILRGVGHIQIITSYISATYYIIILTLSSAYLIWIGKDDVPLKSCTQLQITPNGYRNTVNATECFRNTFLSSLKVHPQYFGIMAVITFVLWFAVNFLLYGLDKSIKCTHSILAPILMIAAVVLAIFLAELEPLQEQLVSCEHWNSLTDPNLWFSTMVQALLSTQIATGYLITAGGTIFKHADIRWISTSIVSYSVAFGWLWVLMWQSIGGSEYMSTNFLSVLLLIYQRALTSNISKVWPMLAYSIVFVSGVITMLTLLYPVYENLRRISGDRWRLLASFTCVLGIVLTIAALTRTLEVSGTLDDLVMPVLVVFAVTMQVVAFVFIYGYNMLKNDISFLTGSNPQRLWVVLWCITPFLFIGTTGWWLRFLLNDASNDMRNLWPLGGILVGVLVVMAVTAAIAVAKEEQFNLISKIAEAFSPSRLWGPEDPAVRYNWMVQRFTNEQLSDQSSSNMEPRTTTPNLYNEKNGYPNMNETYHRAFSLYSDLYEPTDYYHYSTPSDIRPPDTKFFNSPNKCIANDRLSTRLDCNCNRHFTLNVPHEITTNL